MLGRDARRTVYRARDPKIGQVAAIKRSTIQGVLTGEEDKYRQLFVREPLNGQGLFV